MVTVVIGTLLSLALAVAVVAVVAVPARRSGRDLLTERGESVVGGLVEVPRALVSRDSRPRGRHAAGGGLDLTERVADERHQQADSVAARRSLSQTPQP
ncbi:MAG: hypothetical protein ACRCXL_16510 [Dermatophilaceae bacterium]